MDKFLSKFKFVSLVGVSRKLAHSKLCEATTGVGQGSNLRAVVNCFNEVIASPKSSYLMIRFRTHLDIPAS